MLGPIQSFFSLPQKLGQTLYTLQYICWSVVAALEVCTTTVNFHSEAQCMAMQRLRNGLLRRLIYAYQALGWHMNLLFHSLQGICLDALEHVTCWPSRWAEHSDRSTDPAFYLHTCILSTHTTFYMHIAFHLQTLTWCQALSAADGVALPPPAWLHGQVVCDEAVPAIAKQPAPRNVQAPPFVEPIGD